MIIDSRAHRQVLVRRRCRREVGPMEERVHQGRYDGLASEVRIRANRELQDEPLGSAEPNRDFEGGMIEQSAGFVTNRYITDVDEVYVGRPIVVDVLEAILTGLPEIARSVVDCCRAKTLLTEIVRPGRGEVLLPAVDEDLVDRRNDILDRLVAAPCRVARVVGQEHAGAVVDAIRPDAGGDALDAERMEPLREPDQTGLEGRFPGQLPELRGREVQAVDDSIFVRI